MLGTTRQHLVGPSNLAPMVYNIIQATLQQFTSNVKLHVHFGSHPPVPPPPFLLLHLYLQYHHPANQSARVHLTGASISEMDSFSF